MVAVIKTGYSIRRTLMYNENKVAQGVAKCIGASNYPIDHEVLSIDQKLKRLTNQAALNEGVRRNSVHVSLNFHPSENHSPELLNKIAEAYMDKIGFGNQPYLIYEHSDAAHPHIHIVSLKVDEKGDRIETNDIGKDLSSTARREIEESFGLIKAQDSTNQNAYNLEPVNLEKASYGKSQTKRAITNVLDAVLTKYNFTTLGELNAVLKTYNITADRTQEGSRVYEGGGLYYRLLDDDKKIGVPIKASDIYSRPTLKYLDKQFVRSSSQRHPRQKTRLKNAIDLALRNDKPTDITQLQSLLQKSGIAAVLRQNIQGMIFGITFVDHQEKIVYNGSDLDKNKQYSAAGLLKRLADINASLITQSAAEDKKKQQNTATSPDIKSVSQSTSHLSSPVSPDPASPASTPPNSHTDHDHSEDEKSLLEILTGADYLNDAMPLNLKKRRKKKKRK